MGPLVLPVAPACSRALAMGTALCGELLRSTRALLRVGSAGDRIDTGPQGAPPNRATTSFTLVGRSRDFTL